MGGVDDDTLSDTAQRAKQCYRDGRDHASAWYEEAKTSYDMVAGKQWDEEDLAKLKAEQRPAVVFNRIARTINAIVGTQVSNRQETRYIPRELGDTQVNELLTAAAEWVRDQCDAEDEESDAFEDMCVTGMGWTETVMDYESDPEGAIKIERIDPLEMFWDPNAKKRNLSDARWVMRITRMTPDEIAERWPEAELDASSDPWEGEDEDVSARTHVYPQDAYKRDSAAGGKRKRTLRIAQLQWSERVTVYRVGEMAEAVSEKAFRKLKASIEESQIPYIEQKTLRWKQAFVAGGEVLEEDDCPFPEGPTLRCMTYKRDRNTNLWYGVVRAMTDPQRFGNKFFSQILDIINKGAKGGIMAEKDAFDDVAKAEERWARPDSIVFMRPGALAQGKVQPKPLVNLPSGLDRLMQFSMDGVHDVTGINLELLGMANREQAGVLEHQRKQAGLTIIAPLFDGMRRYRKEQGRVLLHYIQRYMSDGRLIRISGASGNEQYVPLAKQSEAARYDIIVDEAPTSPNMKERVFAILSELLPTLLKMGVPMPPGLLDYAPIPSKLSVEWKQMLEQAGGNPQQMQQQMQQMQQQLQALSEENAQLKDKKQEAMAQFELKVREWQAETQLQRDKMQAEITLKREQALADIELEREKAEIALRMNQEQSANAAALEERKLIADTALAARKNAAQAANQRATKRRQP